MVKESRYSPSHGEVKAWLEARRQYDSSPGELEKIAAKEEALRYKYKASVGDYLADPEPDYRHPGITISPAQHEEMQDLISEMATNRIEWAASIAPTVRQIHQIISAESGSDSVETNYYSIDLDPAGEELLLCSKQDGTELARFCSQSDGVISVSGLSKSDFNRFDEGKAHVKSLVEGSVQSGKGISIER